MKAQMKFQKLLTLLTLVMAAIGLVYALSFFSGNLSYMLYYTNKSLMGSVYEGTSVVDGFVNLGQTFVSLMIAFAIAAIVATAFVYLTATHSRRKYYVTNYIATGIIIAVCIAIAAVGIIFMSLLLGEFFAIDWKGTLAEQIAWAIARGSGKEVTQSTTIFILGYVVYGIILVNGLAWILNLVWKIKLMQGEKALLQGGVVKEVA